MTIIECPACDYTCDNWPDFASHVDIMHTRHMPNWSGHRTCFCGKQWELRGYSNWARESLGRHLQEISESGEMEAHYVLWALAL